ncbi:benzoate/H(+) symporter BenE family transporter [Micrococcus luteus]|uniref:benzoate/H(+) symporter BenE family transporter n=1 Tax=Micrococcus luteus TaxID=1270 RepID=UPI0036C51A24
MATREARVERAGCEGSEETRAGRPPVPQRPVPPRRILRDVSPLYAVNGLVAVVFSATGPVAVTLAVGAAGGLSDAALASWVCGMLASAGLATLVMTLLYRRPLAFAWSIPGTVLLGPSLQHLSFEEVVGAFFTCGLLVLGVGLSRVMGRVMAVLPMPIIMAMVAAVFLRFGTDIVDAGRADPVIALPMVGAFILFSSVAALGRRVPAVLAALLAGVAAVVAAGRLDWQPGPVIAWPVFTAPEFTWAAQLELVVPLAVTVLLVQNGQGFAVLSAVGHRPPVNGSAIASGVFSLVNACFGAISACLTGPTNSLLTASGEKSRQYTAALVYALLSLALAAVAPVVVRALLATPEAFVLALGGLAMIRALQQAFVVAFRTGFTMGALATFVVTVSGLDLLGLHAAFWGIVIGWAVSRVMEPHDHVRPRAACPSSPGGFRTLAHP